MKRLCLVILGLVIASFNAIGEDARFDGYAVSQMGGVGAWGWIVSVNNVTNGPADMIGKNISAYLTSVDPSKYPPGFIEQNITAGDHVLVYGDLITSGPGDYHILLVGSKNYYIKNASAPSQPPWWQFCKEWWYGGSVDVTSLTGRFWFFDYPVNLTMTQKSTPLLKNPSWLSFFLSLAQSIFGLLLAVAGYFGYGKLKKGLNEVTNNIEKITNYTLGFYVPQQKAETKDTVTTDAVTTDTETINGFIHSHMRKKVAIDLVSGEQVIGTLKDNNSYAVLLHNAFNPKYEDKGEGEILVFKHSIIKIADRDDYKGFK